MQADNNTENISLPKKVDAMGRAYSTGKRKSSIARVWIKPGNGVITVNGRKEEIYFSSKSHRLLLNQPLISSNRKTEVDIVCTVKGGGLSGQAGAIRHGISKAQLILIPI